MWIACCCHLYRMKSVRRGDPSEFLLHSRDASTKEEKHDHHSLDAYFPAIVVMNSKKLLINEILTYFPKYAKGSKREADTKKILGRPAWRRVTRTSPSQELTARGGLMCEKESVSRVGGSEVQEEGTLPDIEVLQCEKSCACWRS